MSSLFSSYPKCNCISITVLSSELKLITSLGGSLRNESLKCLLEKAGTMLSLVERRDGIIKQGNTDNFDN